jgi:uncharacterized cupin superfamily protein
MRKVSISDPEFVYDPDDPEGYKAGMFRFGRDLGAEQTGTTVYELPPGQAVCPYHYEYGEEEWLMVLAGRPSLRTPEGTSTLQPMDVVFFPKGPAGAHKVTNETADPVRVMMWSQVLVPSASAYPDSDKVGIWTGVEGENVLVRRSSHVEYYDGEV